MIDKRVFAKFSDRIMMYPILMEEIDELNNKVGSVKVSYALCRHYYDKGIPDKPYYISPGKDGQSVQYFPNFKNKHWMRLYWFNHFADAAYMKLFSVWDSVTEILDTFYGMNIDKNMRFKFRVMDELKQKDYFDEENSYIDNIISEIGLVFAIVSTKYVRSFIERITMRPRILKKLTICIFVLLAPFYINALFALLGISQTISNCISVVGIILSLLSYE